MTCFTEVGIRVSKVIINIEKKAIDVLALLGKSCFEQGFLVFLQTHPQADLCHLSDSQSKKNLSAMEKSVFLRSV